MRIYFIGLFIFLVMLCCSCVSSFKMGVYNGKKGSINPNEFIFFKDSTFSYRHYGAFYEHSNGKFKIKNNKIILNSDLKDIVLPMSFSITSSDTLIRINKNKITVRLEIPKVRKLEDYMCIPLLNQDTIDVEYGVYIIYSSTPLDSIKFNIEISPFVIGRPRVPTSTNSIYFDKVLGKDITFNLTIDETLFGYRIFDNTLLDIKRNKIFFPETREGNEHLLKKEINNRNILYLMKE